MYKFIHISDLHFNRTNNLAIRAFLDFIAAHREAVLLITGDLTQSNLPDQYQNLKEFLDRMPNQKVIIPGNHDIYYFNLYKRFFKPHLRYLEYTNSPIEPDLHLQGVSILGVRTTNQFKIQSGSVWKSTLQALHNRIKASPPHNKIILLCHHPNVLIRKLLKQTNSEFKQVVLILSGHTHKQKTEVKNGIMLHTTGTTISSRLRNEANSFSRFLVKQHFLDLEIYSFKNQEFTLTHKQSLQFTTNN